MADDQEQPKEPSQKPPRGGGGKPTKRPDAVAGAYKLLYDWTETAGMTNGVRELDRHYAGDVVQLNETDAARFLRSGVVECTTAHQREAPAAQAVPPLVRARQVNEALGPRPHGGAQQAVHRQVHSMKAAETPPA
jgi:hypothetical protein